MKRFTGHDEKWGKFVDVKINAPDLITKSNYDHRNITIGSVTDPYQPAEKKYQITRKILKKLISFKSSFDIITKSNLVIRDIDLLKQFSDMTIAISVGCTDESIRKYLDPKAPTIEKRIKALKILHQNNIKTALFVSPIFPVLSD